MSRVQADPTKWIDEDLYRTTILSLDPSTTELEVDEQLQNDARELGITITAPKNGEDAANVDVAAESLSGTTISSHNQRNSIFSQSTAPTSCGSSARRSSTSLSQQSYLAVPLTDNNSAMSNHKVEQVKNSGFKNSLKKLQVLRRKKQGTPVATTIVKARGSRDGSSSDDTVLYKLKDTEVHQSHVNGLSEDMFSKNNYTSPSVDESASDVLSSLDCEALRIVRAQQIEEKRKFLEYQTKLIQELLDERNEIKERRRAVHKQKLAEEEEQNDKAAEELEARQLEEEFKQQREHDAEKKAIAVRLKHMEAYCQTPSPPLSPVTTSFDRRTSGDSMASHPERQVTQQHYENLAQVYHSRDNMDSLHTSKINVLRGKQKRALQTFMSKKEREIKALDQLFDREMDALDVDYGQKEAEIRSEFETKRQALEARWKLRSLVEKARLERITGLKYDDMPDLIAVEA